MGFCRLWAFGFLKTAKKEGLMAERKGCIERERETVVQINNGILSGLGSHSLPLFLSLFLSLCPVRGPPLLSQADFIAGFWTCAK